MKHFMTLLITLFFLSLWSNNLIAQNKPEDFTEKAWNLFYKQDKKDSAIILLNKAIKLYPKDVPTFIWLGRLYHDNKQYEKAKTIYDRALLLDPKNIECIVRKALSCYKLKQYQEMEICFQKAIKLEPNNAATYGYMIQIHYLEGRYKKVISDVSTYKKLGDVKDFILVYGLISEALTRQFDKSTNLPPTDWNPSYKPFPDLTFQEVASPWLEQLCEANINDRSSVMGDNTKGSTSGKRYKFAGTKESPFEYAAGCYIWDATVIFDEKYGILISNGSKIKYTSIINNIEVTKYGTVKNWSFVWE